MCVFQIIKLLACAFVLHAAISCGMLFQQQLLIRARQLYVCLVDKFEECVLSDSACSFGVVTLALLN